MTLYTTDIVIIGAGPVGLFAVFEAGMLKMKCHVIDALEAAGGQCTALYPEKPIYDIPAHPSILAEALVEKLKEQAAPFQPVYHFGQRVIRLSAVSGQRSDVQTTDNRQPTTDNWMVTTDKGVTIHCKAVIIAAGCGAFGPNRPPLQNIEDFEGSAVFYMVGQREQFRGKKIVIAGGGDSAVDWANSLAELAEKIYVVHRRAKFRAAPESVSKMESLVASGKIEMVVPYQLHGLTGTNGQLTSVEVATLEGDVKSLDANILLPFFGLSMELGPIANWGLNLTHNHIAVEPATMQTNQAGIFAIGDIATYAGKLKLILCGFSEAAMACHAAYKLVYPDQELHFEYSTSKGVTS